MFACGQHLFFFPVEQQVMDPLTPCVCVDVCCQVAFPVALGVVDHKVALRTYYKVVFSIETRLMSISSHYPCLLPFNASMVSVCFP